MIYYISDYHFFRTNKTSDGESNLPLFEKRGFKDVLSMNEYIIKQWNSRIQDNDIVYFIGDFSHGTVDETIDILKRLKGHKNLVLGNYDSLLVQNSEIVSYFDNIDYYMEVFDSGSKIVMCHYPLLWYDKSKNDDYMFHGHLHDVSTDVKLMDEIESLIKEKSLGAHFSCTYINCYCEFSDYIPLTKDEWLNFFNKSVEN